MSIVEKNLLNVKNVTKSSNRGQVKIVTNVKDEGVINQVSEALTPCLYII